MSRFLVAGIVVLTLVTGFLLGQLGSLERPMASGKAQRDRESAETARLFYASINRYLASNELMDLERMLAADFANHSPYAAQAETGEEFLRELGWLRSTYPGVQMEVRSLSAQSGIVALEITLIGVARVLDSGLGAGLIGYEVLHIKQGRITERWGNRSTPPLYRSTLESSFHLPHSRVGEVRIVRLDFDHPGAVTFVRADSITLMGERGTVSCQMPAQQASSDSKKEMTSEGVLFCKGDPATAMTVSAGEIVSVQGKGWARLENTVDDQASLIVVLLNLRSFGDPEGATFDRKASEGVRFSLVGAEGVQSDLASGEPMTLTVSQVILPAGERMSAHVASAAELLVISDGAIEVGIYGGKGVLIESGQNSKFVDTAAIVNSGSGIRINTGSTVEYRVSGSEPAILLMMTITTPAG